MYGSCIARMTPISTTSEAGFDFTIIDDDGVSCVRKFYEKQLVQI